MSARGEPVSQNINHHVISESVFPSTVCSSYHLDTSTLRAMRLNWFNDRAEVLLRTEKYRKIWNYAATSRGFPHATNIRSVYFGLCSRLPSFDSLAFKSSLWIRSGNTALYASIFSSILLYSCWDLASPQENSIEQFLFLVPTRAQCGMVSLSLVRCKCSLHLTSPRPGHGRMLLLLKWHSYFAFILHQI